ncbi:MAG: Holliday junction branch migration protein RuvA [Bacteroidia bacterium]|nr:MAG: Holliday junction branch migration protein RuvA [Bacteroidia bacterium]
MIEFIEGRIASLFPTHIVVDTGGIGYFINISLFTYSQLEGKKEIKILVHEVIREDAHLLFGFFTAPERELFRLLISVSGVGANTARMMLSSVEPAGIESAILQADVNILKGIKGIGLKTAQRIIVDLKDKVGKSPFSAEIFGISDNTVKDEAFTALVMLGFPKNAVGKVLENILLADKDLSVELLIKKALKIL